MSSKDDTIRHPEPLPQRTPFEAMAAHGIPPVQPPRDRRAYQSPGAPPWDNGRHKTSVWAVVVACLGSMLVMLACAGVFALIEESGPVPATSVTAVAPASVTTSGTCEKKIVGEYGLVATVRATNTTEQNLTGTIWVRWPITGEAAQEFVKLVTLAPGESAELLVNEGVMAERWLRMGECSYGWTLTP